MVTILSRYMERRARINESIPRFHGIRNNRYALVYLLPMAAVFLVFTIIPTLFVGVISLFHWNVLSPALSQFVGLKNYQDLLQSPVFWHSLLISLLFVLGTVPTTVFIAVAIAVLLMDNLPLRGLVRTGVFSPYITPVVATSIIWIWMLNPQFGLINSLLHAAHLPAVQWLESPHWALLGVILFTLWHNMGFDVIIFMAGLTSLSSELGEAAKVDGASSAQRFVYVTWPLLSPTTFFVTIITTIGSLQAFTQFFTMTQGGPLGATTTASYLVYEMGFLFFHEGFASAIAVVMFLIIALLTIVQWKMSERRVHYQ